MLGKIVNRVTKAISGPESADTSPADREHAIRLATAVLMVEVARSDYEYDETEFELLLSLISRHFDVSSQDAIMLANEASIKSEELVSLYSFTQLLHMNLTEKEKSKIVSLLWKIAYADGRLDKYEDSMVLKISDLLYVSRGRVMRLKHDAKIANVSN